MLGDEGVYFPCSLYNNIIICVLKLKNGTFDKHAHIQQSANSVEVSKQIGNLQLCGQLTMVRCVEIPDLKSKSSHMTNASRYVDIRLVGSK